MTMLAPRWISWLIAPNGSTFIATNSYIVAVDKTGKELYTLRNMMVLFGK
jgi:hypothetical protein